MVNGQSKPPVLAPVVPEIIIPPPKDAVPVKTCHRFFAPVVFPEPDRIDPRKANITPRLGNFDCIGVRCTLWNDEAKECRDVTDSKSRATIAEYAYNKTNDVHIQNAGA
jgi:hypothetical protein